MDILVHHLYHKYYYQLVLLILLVIVVMDIHLQPHLPFGVLVVDGVLGVDGVDGVDGVYRITPFETDAIFV